MAKFIKKINRSLITTERSARLSFFKERTIKTLFFCTALLAVVVVSFILLFLLRDGYPIFVEVGIIPFLFGDTWAPTAVEPLYGILPLIVGTLLVTIGAIVFAVPLSIGCAIYVSELASPRVKSVLKPAIELLAGIPSVVYGFFGLIVLTDFIRVTFDVPTGETWLAASVLLGIMALPTIISVSEDAISAVPGISGKAPLQSGRHGGRLSAGSLCLQPFPALLLRLSLVSAGQSVRRWPS